MAQPSRKPTSLAESIATGQFIGLAEADVRDWFRDNEACGWAKADGSPIGNWARDMCYYRDRIRTEQHKSKRSVWELKQIIEAKHNMAEKLKAKSSYETPTGREWTDQKDRETWKELRKEIKELVNEMVEL